MAVTSQAVFEAVADFAKLDAAINRTEGHLRRLRTTGREAGDGVDRGLQRVAGAAAQAAPAHERAARSASQHERANRGLSRSNEDLTRSTRSASAATERQGGFIKTLMDKVGKLRLAIAGVATVISVTLGAALISGFKRFTTIEDSTKALGTAMGSTTKAAEVMKEVLEVVRGTPFNLDQFAEAAKNLIVFGIEAEKVPSILTAIGEAAAASGSGAESVAVIVDTLGQAATIGRFTGDTILRLAQQGVPALQILANTFGVTNEQMQKMVSDGAIPAAEGIDALVKGIMEGTDGINGATIAFGGSMEGLRTTLSGVLGGMGASVARFGASIITEFQGPLKSGIIAATDLLDAAGKKTGAFLRNVGTEYMPTIINFFRLLVPLVKGVFEGYLSVALASIIVMFQGFITVLKITSAVLGAMPEGVLRFIGIVIGLTIAWRGLNAVMKSSLIQAVITKIFSLIGLMGALQTQTAAAAVSQGLLRASSATLGSTFSSLVSTGNLYALAIGAIVAGVYLLLKQANKLSAANQTTAEGAEAAAKSLGLQFGAVQQVGAAAEEATPSIVDLYKENKILIEQLAGMDKQARETMLFNIGIRLVQGGEDPAKVFKGLQDLAAATGLDIDLDFDASSLIDAGRQADELSERIRDVIAAADDLDFDVRGNPLKALTNDINGLIESTTALVGQGDIAGAAKAIEDFVAETESLPDLQRDGARIEFFNGLAKSLNLSGFSMDSMAQAIREGKDPIAELFRQLNVEGASAPGKLIEYANAVQTAADALGGDYIGAIAQVNRDQPELAKAVAEATEEMQANEDAALGLASAYEQTEEEVKELETAIKATADALAGFTNAGSIYGNVLKATEEAEKERAEGAADAVNESTKAKREAYDKDTKAQLDNIKEINDAQVRRLREDDSITSEHIAQVERANQAEQEAFSDSRETADEAKASWQDFVKDVTVSLSDYAAAIDKQLKSAKEFTANLSAVFSKYGETVGLAVQEMGVEGIDLAAGLAAGGKEADITAGKLRELADLQASAEDISKRQRILGAFSEQVLKAGEAPSIEEVRNRVGVGSTAEVIAALAEFGTDAQRQFALEQSILLSDASGSGEAIATAVKDGLIGGLPAFAEAIRLYAEALRTGLNPVIVELNGKLLVQTDTTRAGTADGGAQYGGAAAAGAPAAEPSGLASTAPGKTGLQRYADSRRGGWGSFARGGFTFPDMAQIQPGRGQGLIQWAEGSTKGESLIPLDTADPNKLRRSLKIWEETGERLGALPPMISRLNSPRMFAMGGFTAANSKLSAPTIQRFADGGFTQSASPNLSSVPTSAHTHYEIPNATIVANDPKELWRSVEDEARLKSLSGTS